MHHPWRELRERGDGVVLHFTRFNDTRIAATNGNNAIWLDQDLLQVERRCALAHELCHIDLGHTTAPTPVEETRARHCAARRLIDWDDLVDAFRWSDSVAEAADELWVTERVLMDRIHGLSAAERALLIHITTTR